ncbi:MAG: 4Fe-4S binding protein [Panacagrimonas sp.]
MPDESGFENATQLYIDPTKCTDCGACEEACPVTAIFAADSLPKAWTHYARINAEHFERAAREPRNV